MKTIAVARCAQEGIEISQHEKDFASEVDYEIRDNGKIVERASQINLSRNLRFAFNLCERAFRMHGVFDPSEEWWGCLQESLKVRDRLTHPRTSTDLDVSTAEMNKVTKAYSGFTELIDKYLDIDIDNP
jgi:hypothetical protein